MAVLLPASRAANCGTLVVVNAACRGVGTTGGTPGVRTWRDSALISAKSCCKRATASIKMFSGDHETFRRSVPSSLSLAFIKIWGATRSPSDANVSQEPGGPRVHRSASLLGGVTTPAPAYLGDAVVTVEPGLLHVQTVYTSCGFCLQASGLPSHRRGSSHPFHFGRAPCRGSIRNQSSSAPFQGRCNVTSSSPQSPTSHPRPQPGPHSTSGPCLLHYPSYCFLQSEPQSFFKKPRSTPRPHSKRPPPVKAASSIIYNPNCTIATKYTMVYGIECLGEVEIDLINICSLYLGRGALQQ